MDNRRKRKLSFITIGLIFLLSGVEYGKMLWVVTVNFLVLQLFQNEIQSLVVFPLRQRYFHHNGVKPL